ncbi:MAG: MraY family glycosyltransferase [Thermogutta sp.]
MTQQMLVYAALSCLAAIITSALITRLVCYVAPRVGLMDNPDGKRKLHSKPTPLGGGIAIFASVCLVLAGNIWLPNPWGLRFHQDRWDLVVLFVAACWLVLVGLLDDLVGLRGRHKLLAQTIAAVILVAGGYSFSRVSVMGISFEFGWFGPAVAVLWFLATINSINLLDGMDGQAATLGAIFSFSIGIMACITGHHAVAFVAFVLAGATIGFLWFNLPPARIFLGDTGSMFIGLMLGCLAARASLKGPSTFLLAIAISLWTLPFLDSFAAILRRTLAGRTIYAADRGHIHHCLMSKTKSGETALMVIAVCAALTAVASVYGVVSGNDMIALVVTCGVIAFLIVTGLFGRAECRLVLNTIRHFGDSIGRCIFGENGQSICNGTQLQGQHDWDSLWNQLTGPAYEYNVLYLRVDLNDPRIQESYLGEWKLAEASISDETPISRCEFPLWVQNRVVGKIRASIRRSVDTFQRDLEFVVSLVEPFENHLEQLNINLAQQSMDDAHSDEIPAAHIVLESTGLSTPHSTPISGVNGKKTSGNLGNGNKVKDAEPVRMRT